MNRRPRRFPRRRFDLSAMLLLVTAGLLVWSVLIEYQRPDVDPVAATALTTGQVTRVIDGDTLLLEDGRRIRLLGIDTPETKHPDRPVEAWGERATQFTRAFCEGRVVHLEWDRHRTDRHGRYLAYVTCRGKSLNEELVLAGLARAETRFPLQERMKRRLREAQLKAQSAQNGIWSEQQPSQPQASADAEASRTNPITWPP